MSILVKGMDMPRYCGQCAFCLQIHSLCVYCMATGHEIKYSETDLKDGMCPLVEVVEEGFSEVMGVPMQLWREY